MQVPRLTAWFGLLFISFLMLAVKSSDAQTPFPIGTFSSVRKVPGLDTGHRDESPFVSPDGLMMVFNSDRPHLPSNIDTSLRDIFIATRKSTNDPFGEPIRLSEPTNLDGFSEHDPYLSPNGETLYFNSTRPIDGAIGGMSTTWATALDGSVEPIPVTMGLASPPETRIGGTRFATDMLSAYFYRGNGNSTDLFWARRESINDDFSPAEPLTNLNSPNLEELWHDLSSDGLTMFFAKAELGFTRPRTYVATRSSLEEEFERPVLIDNAFPGGSRINLQGAVFDPFVTKDWPSPGSKLYFAATNAFRDFDIWEATWTIPNADFTDDNNVDADDLDALVQAVAASSNDLVFDLDGSETSNDGDIETWLDLAAQLQGRHHAFMRGDSNLDSHVDSQDLNVVGLNWNQPVNTWSGGDFNADGFVDSTDLNFIGLNWQSSIAEPDAISVPEPSGAIWCWFAAVLWLAEHRRKLG